MAFFSNLAKMVRKQKPMMANRRGGFLGRLSNMIRKRPQMMERMRNLSGMRGMGRGMFNPNMQFGIMGLNPMMARSMKARMMGLPDPADMPFGIDVRPGNPILGGSDYMPKVNPGMTQPIDVGGPVDPAPGMGPIMTQPIANPGQPQPIDSGPKPIDYSGYLDFYKNPPVPGRVAAPVPPSTGKPLPVMPGALSMSTGGGVNVGDLAVSAARGAYKAKTAPLQLAATVSNVIAPNTKLSRGLSKLATPFAAGGEAKKYPNEGLAALAKEAPEVVERMGYAPGGMVMKPLSKLAGRSMVAGVDKDMTQAISEQQQFDRIAANQAYERFYDSQPPNVQAYLPAPVTALQAQSEVGDDTVSFGGKTLPTEFLQAGPEVFDNPSILMGPVGAGLGALARTLSDLDRGLPNRGESMEIRPGRDMTNSRKLDALNVGRTISEQDRQMLADILGITNADELPARDVYYALQSIRNNPELRDKLDDLMVE